MFMYNKVTCIQNESGTPMRDNLALVYSSLETPLSGRLSLP